MSRQAVVEKGGFTVVHEAQEPKVPKVDIVFIHGVDGHPKDTWTWNRDKSPTKRRANDRPPEQPSPTKLMRLDGNAEQARHHQTPNTEDAESEKESNSEWLMQDSVFWPADLLPLTVPDTRILVYGWNSGIRSRKDPDPVSDTRIRGHAESLLTNLEIERREPDNKQRPLLFVAHSLGGIVVKEALRQAERHGPSKPHLHQIYESTIGILFFGTPHRGGNVPSFPAAPILGLIGRITHKINDNTLQDLQPDSQMLEQLRTEFPKLCRAKKWMIYSFQEEIGTFLGPKCVADVSSYMDDTEIEERVRITRDHVDMVKYTGKTDQEYKKVAAAITRIFDECKDVIERNAKAISAALKREMEGRLNFDAMDKRVTNLAAAQQGTCSWFLETKAYEAWQNPAKQSEHGGFLWIKGNPGTGKSTLMKFLFETTKDRLRRDPDQIVASFFFSARGAVEEKTTKGLYRALLHQIFQWAPGLNASLECMSRNGAQGIAANGWSEEALKQTLERAILRLGERSLTVFIDALDECDGDQAKGMVTFIEELCAKDTTRKGHLQICLSSRHYPDIAIGKGIEVILERSRGHAEDLKKYIQSKLRLGNSEAARLLGNAILERSSLIFLWVVLVIDILNSAYAFTPVERMRELLDEIPSELANLFEMILRRDDNGMDPLRSCFRCILFASRPLSPKELYSAINFCLYENDSSPAPWEGFGKEKVEANMARFVRETSKGLAEIVKVKGRREVQFIHESVRDFLLGKHGSQWSEASENLEGFGHEALRDCCWAQVKDAYDDFRAPGSRAWCAEVPFRPSPTPERDGLKDSDEEIWGRPVTVPRKNRPDGKKASRSQSSQPAKADYKDQHHSIRRTSRSEALSAQYGYEGPRYNGSQDRPICAVDGSADKLWVPRSVSGGKVEMQRYPPPGSEYRQVDADGWDSLDESSDTEGRHDYNKVSSLKGRRKPRGAHSIRDSPKLRPLPSLPPPFLAYAIQNVLHHANMAAKYGRDQTNFLSKFPLRNWIALLANAIPDSEQYSTSTSLLYILAEKNHAELIKAYQEETSSVFWVGAGRYGPPMFAALATESHEAAQALLVRQIARNLSKSAIQRVYKRYNDGRNRHAPEGPHNSPLHREFTFDKKRGLLPYIVEDGNRMVLEVLLRTCEVDVNILDKHGDPPTLPLSIAALRGYADIVELLLARGAKIELKGKHGMTALSHAADAGQTETATLLLCHGADINTTCNWKRTPLSYAASKLSSDMVRLLLSRKANLEAKDIDGRSALSYASAKKSQDCVTIIRLLLEKYANTESRDRDGRTPLAHAAKEGCVDALKVLCSRGAQVDSQDDHLRTPIWHASEAGHREVVRVLLEKGARVDPMDRLERTPLSIAAERGHKSVVELLLRRDAMANSRDVNGRTPGWYASNQQHEEVMRLLGAAHGRR
ncbi:hypothetical protein OQA88_10506 [Cercophora sp. LCS_1]